MQVKAIERYRHAVSEKSQAEEMFQKAVQYFDSYRWRYAIEYWKIEVKKAYAELDFQAN